MTSSCVPSLHVTLTGVDEHTPMAILRDLVDSSAVRIELGFLYSATPEGRTRYPAHAVLERLLLQATGAKALHVCGSIARSQLLQQSLGELAAHVQRIQINGTLSPHEVEAICELYPHHRIITQHTEANTSLLDVVSPNHEVLVDRSGGRGISPKEWERPATDKPCGFAGGLGPHNLAGALTTIAGVARGHWWADMEQSLRSEQDCFDVERVAQVIQLAGAFAAGDARFAQVRERRVYA